MLAPGSSSASVNGCASRMPVLLSCVRFLMQCLRCSQVLPAVVGLIVVTVVGLVYWATRSPA